MKRIQAVPPRRHSNDKNLMERRRLSLTIATLLCMGITARAQAPARPAWVEQAIEMGTRTAVHPYPIKRLGKQLGSFTTPFLRVAIAASEAKKKLIRFEPGSVTAEMLADVIIVTVPPIMSSEMGGPLSYRSSAEHIVIKKPKSKNPDDAIQPSSEEPFTETQSNLMGGKVEARGVIASFPLAALQDGSVFYFVYEQKKSFEFSITREMISQTIRN